MEAGLNGAGGWDGVERRDVVSRRRRRLYRFMNRRGGFDRRRQPRAVAYVLDNSGPLIVALVLLNVLSLADGFYTAVETGLGIAREGNPVLAAAAAQHPLLAFAVKVGSMGMVTAIIWFNRRRRAVLVTGMFGLAAYAALVGYHRYALATLGLL